MCWQFFECTKENFLHSDLQALYHLSRAGKDELKAAEVLSGVLHMHDNKLLTYTSIPGVQEIYCVKNTSDEELC